jgi:PBSX family phage terminase large subunit
VLSPKQESFLYHSDAFINICDGSVRSGKTHAALRRLGEYAITGPPGDLCIMGKTERTIKSNVVFPLQDMYEPGAIRYVQGAGQLFIFGRRCWIIGVNDVRAEEKVRGMTLAGGYMNELTLYPQEVFDQTIARSLSIPGAKFFADTNPDSPYHWLMEHYLEAGHPKSYLKRWRFNLSDNPILPAKNIEMLKVLYGPGTLYYRRNIDGDWVLAEGVIYDMFDPRIHVTAEWPTAFDKVVVGADYGTSTVTCFLMIGRSVDDGNWLAFREYYYDAQKENRQKTDAEFSTDFAQFLSGDGYPDPYGRLHPSSIELDPSAASFRLQLRRDGIQKVRHADNEVLDGIRVVGSALTGGHYKIHEVCENLQKEKTSYVWDEKAVERGEDKPLKQSDHSQDTERYTLARAIGKKRLSLVANSA